jgi:hypothetical protein
MALVVFASAWRVSLPDGTSHHYKKPMIFSPLIVGTEAPQNWNPQVTRLDRCVGTNPATSLEDLEQTTGLAAVSFYSPSRGGNSNVTLPLSSMTR